MGIELKRVEVVPDDVADIAETVLRLSRSFDYVFTSGGIGPTHDDVTYEAVAKAFVQPLAYHEPTLSKLNAFYEARKRTVNDAAKRMALFPAGAKVMELPKPLWAPLVVCSKCVCSLDAASDNSFFYVSVYIMPGVPQLFSAFVENLPAILGSHGKIHRLLLYTSQLEIDIAETLTKAASAFSTVSIGSYPRVGEQLYSVMVSIEGRNETDVSSCAAFIAKHIRAFSTPQENFENKQASKL